MLEEYGIKDRKELVSGMFELMHKYGGIGLSAIQVGLLSICLLQVAINLLKKV